MEQRKATLSAEEQTLIEHGHRIRAEDECVRLRAIIETLQKKNAELVSRHEVDETMFEENMKEMRRKVERQVKDIEEYKRLLLLLDLASNLRVQEWQNKAITTEKELEEFKEVGRLYHGREGESENPTTMTLDTTSMATSTSSNPEEDYLDDSIF